MKRRIGIGLLLLIVLIGFPLWITYREYRQAMLDHALIEVIKAEDDKKALEALAEGASGEARDISRPPNFREAVIRVLDRFQHPGRNVEQTENTPALLLLYKQKYQDSMSKNCYDSGPSPAVIVALLNQGANVHDHDVGGWTPLLYASAYPDVNIVRLMLKKGARIEEVPQGESTPLGNAAYHNHPGVVRLLLEQGANTEAEDGSQMTPLSWAAQLNYKDVVLLLLEHGANINKGNTMALMCAAGCNSADVVRILLEHGAKINVKDQNGKTALDYARDSLKADPVHNPDAPKIIALLRKFGAK